MKSINIKKFIKIIVSVISLILVFSILFLLTRCSTEIEQLKTYKSLKSYPSVTDEIIAENSKFTLLWNDDDKQVYLFDKVSNTEWGPKKVEVAIDDETTVSKKIPKIFSPIYISYYDKDSCTVVEDVLSSSSCIDNDTVASKKTKKGLLVRYDFSKEKISVSVEYSLTDDGMAVYIDKSLITEKSDKLLVSVSVSPYMCSINEKDDDSYLFVPSGSGALIYPEITGSKIIRTVNKVFGDDESINKKYEFYKQESVRLPVYGSKNGNKGICAIVEDDAGTAEIVSVSQDKNTGVSAVYSRTYIRGYDIIDMPEGFGSGGTTKLISNPKSDSVFKVSFLPFSGENCSYVNMADIYRDYLYKTAKISKKKENSDVAINLNIIGAAELQQHFLGIPYNGLVPLTTINDVKKIAITTDKIIGNNFSMILNGFSENGIDLGKPAGNGKISSKLGNWSSLKNLMEFSKNKKINTYVQFDTVRYNSGGFGCSSFKAASRVDNKRVILTYKNKVSGMPDPKAKLYNLVGRGELNTVNNKLLSNLEKHDIDSVCLDTLTSMAYSDYSDKEYFITGNIENQVSTILKNYKNNNIKILGSDANSYATVFCDHITNVPLESSNDDGFSVSIPFYEIVFKGYIPMSSKAINSFYSIDEGILKAVESGIGISYSMVNKYNDILMYSNQNLSYVNTSEEIFEELKGEKVKNYIKYFNEIKGASISEHQIIGDNVRKVVFDNGICTYINYGNETVTVDNIEILPLNFVYEKGGKING